MGLVAQICVSYVNFVWMTIRTARNYLRITWQKINHNGMSFFISFFLQKFRLGLLETTCMLLLVCALLGHLDTSVCYFWPKLGVVIFYNCKINNFAVENPLIYSLLPLCRHSTSMNILKYNLINRKVASSFNMFWYLKEDENPSKIILYRSS